jgi:hypothetical protein
MDAAPDPTPAEIEASAAKIREHWSEAERRRRRVQVADRLRGCVDPSVTRKAAEALNRRLHERRG